MGTEGSSQTAVFERQATLESWDRDYYNPVAERYYDRAVSTMLELMEAQPGATVLDAGCGPGVHSVRAARSGYRVCAIDISKNMLREAESRAVKSGLSSSVEFREEDLTRLTFPDASFRYVFSWGVIIHIPEVEKTLDELARIIEPGGKLALYVTNKNSWDQKLESMARFVLRKPLEGRETLALGDGVWFNMSGEKLWVWQFDVDALCRQLERRGLFLTHRVIGEFSEVQRRVSGPLRSMLLRLNNLCYRLKLPPGIASANLLVFRKGSDIRAASRSAVVIQAG